MLFFFIAVHVCVRRGEERKENRDMGWSHAPVFVFSHPLLCFSMCTGLITEETQQCSMRDLFPLFNQAVQISFFFFFFPLQLTASLPFFFFPPAFSFHSAECSSCLSIQNKELRISAFAVCVPVCSKFFWWRCFTHQANLLNTFLNCSF